MVDRGYTLTLSHINVTFSPGMSLKYFFSGKKCPKTQSVDPLLQTAMRSREYAHQQTGTGAREWPPFPHMLRVIPEEMCHVSFSSANEFLSSRLPYEINLSRLSAGCCCWLSTLMRGRSTSASLCLVIQINKLRFMAAYHWRLVLLPESVVKKKKRKNWNQLSLLEVTFYS